MPKPKANLSEEVIPRDNLRKYCEEVIEACDKRARELKAESTRNAWRKKRYKQMLMDINQMDLFDENN